ncbi:phosphatase domain-containing protein [Histidinibacterium aquaticum]|uniref:phosphatase domain-containing protein n=1 Tax=Histidinibacterium aquaticum TaxID=2613962 RepID=UPI00168B058E|nr:phosphatase domain-containing protein [Histidinibacterium aquaticum]
MIDPYVGYATSDTIVLRGRVLTALRRGAPRPEQGRLTNFRQMVRLFLTNEVSDVVLAARGVEAHSDEEGYFVLRVPRKPGEEGWIEIPVREIGHVQSPGAEPVPWEGDQSEERRLSAYLPGDNAKRGIISDIDDTMLETGAWRASRMLWTSLTGNVHTRRIFDDAVRLMDLLSREGRDPVFYVSSSPWNLHDFLYRLFERHGLVLGPFFLRDLGVAEDKFITANHGEHKARSIDTILSANPSLPFVLVGDTGQHDAEIYAAAARRHPGRVKRVILRAPGRGADAADMVHIRTLRSKGIPVHVGPDFSEALEALGAEA